MDEGDCFEYDGPVTEFSAGLLERTVDGSWLEEEDFAFLSVVDEPFTKEPEDYHPSYVETIWEEWDELDANEIEELKKNEADNISYNPTTRRVMDEVVVREDLLQSGGPCRPELWVEEPDYCSPGKPYSTIHYPGVLNLDGTHYGPGTLVSDAAMAAKYGIPVERWRGNVAFHKAQIQSEQATEEEPVELPGFVFAIVALKEELNSLRCERENFSSTKELSFLNGQIEETQERLDNLYFQIGRDLAETIDRSDVKKFDYLPCSWLPQFELVEDDIFQWKEQARREYFKGSELPVCEFDCPHVLLVLKQDYYNHLQAVKGMTNHETSSLSSNEREAWFAGETESAAFQHRANYSKDYAEELLNVTAPYLYPGETNAPKANFRTVEKKAVREPVSEEHEKFLDEQAEIWAKENKQEQKNKGGRPKSLLPKDCQGCGKHFSQSYSCTRHIKSCANYLALFGLELEKPYLCGARNCEKSFTRKDAAVEHRRICPHYEQLVEQESDKLRLEGDS